MAQCHALRFAFGSRCKKNDRRRVGFGGTAIQPGCKRTYYGAHFVANRKVFANVFQIDQLATLAQPALKLLEFSHFNKFVGGYDAFDICRFQGCLYRLLTCREVQHCRHPPVSRYRENAQNGSDAGGKQHTNCFILSRPANQRMSKRVRTTHKGIVRKRTLVAVS